MAPPVTPGISRVERWIAHWRGWLIVVALASLVVNALLIGWIQSRLGFRLAWLVDGFTGLVTLACCCVPLYGLRRSDSTTAPDPGQPLASQAPALEPLRSELHAMARRLMTAQEDERHAISRELHDDIGQQITAIKLATMALQHNDDSRQREEIIGEIIEITDHTVAKLRNLSLLLRPPQLDALGLEAALRGHASLLFRNDKPKLTFSLTPLSQRPDPDVELACFRIAQEALTNVLRHARAERVTVSLTIDGDQVRLTVSDDGLGFDPERVRGLGMITMRERAQQVGGTLEIKTGEGTWVRATLPLGQQATAPLH